MLHHNTTHSKPKKTIDDAEIGHVCAPCIIYNVTSSRSRFLKPETPGVLTPSHPRAPSDPTECDLESREVGCDEAKKKKAAFG